MSNSRRLRKPASKKLKSKRGTVTPEEHRGLASVRGSLGQLDRRGLVDKDGWMPGEHGARQRAWRISEEGKRHALFGVRVDPAQAVTPSGLLRAPVPRGWLRYRDLLCGSLLHITDTGTGATGLARVVRINERRHLMYLDPEWGAEPAAPRSQADARAAARATPEPCPSCGAVTGEDCTTSGGKKAAWPHAPRDPRFGGTGDDATGKLDPAPGSSQAKP